MKKLLLIVVVLMMLGGCGEKTKTTTCAYKQDAFDYQVIMESKEDKIEKMRYISVLDFAALGVDDESLIESVIAQLAGIYEGMEGVTYEHELTDGVLTEKTSIEIAKTTLDDLIQIGVVGEDAQSVDLKLSEITENFTSQGFECK